MRKDDEILVSVIIPVFNVQEFFEKCITSIMRQTHKNIEIIVVDDGSTDNSGRIVDEYSCKDNRIVAIHQTNAGVSVARNNGMKVAKGDYVSFVDGDDYVSPKYVEYLLSIATSTNADFVFSKNCYSKAVEEQIQTDNIREVCAPEAIGLLLSPSVIVGCWNKLYRRSFLEENGITFSKDLFYGEGLTYITDCARLSNKTAVGLEKHYYYRRNNEMSATASFNIEKIRNGEKALKKIYEKICILDSDYMRSMYTLHMSLFYSGAITRLTSSGLKQKYKKDYHKWTHELDSMLPKLLKSRYVSFYRKGLVIGARFFPKSVALMDIVRRKRIAEQSC